MSTDWLSESEDLAESQRENSDELLSLRGTSGDKPLSEASEDKSIAEFFTPRPSDPDAEIPGFGTAVATPTQPREAGEAAGRRQL